MLKKRNQVMVIGHEASISGAPLLLLNLFRLLIEREIVNVQFVLRHDGPLVEEYAKLATVIVLKPEGYGSEKNIVLKSKNFFKSKVQLLKILFKALSCDYLFFNTVVNGKLLRWFYFHRKPVVTYVHELEKVIDLYIKQKDATMPLAKSQAILYPATLTMDLLFTKYKIPVAKLKRLSYYFPFSAAQYNFAVASNKKHAFRKMFQIEGDVFLVGGMGKVSDRKGIDLFIEVCKKVLSLNGSISFCWVGDFESNEQEITLRRIIQDNQLEGKLIFTGPFDYDLYNLSPFDVFFLSSKEDTYPLVVLEAAMMKVPTVCFSQSGGIVEFLNDDAGWLINDFSINRAASKLIELEANRGAVQAYGERAFEKVVSSHCNPDFIISQYTHIVENLNF